VGDSRAYRLRGGRLERLTADHSVVADLERRGLLTAEEAALHPRRNEIFRSVGVAPDVEVEIAAVDVEPGDRFLLCSDGLCGVLADDEIAAVLKDTPAPEAVRELVERVHARGAPDNVTVLVTSVPSPDQRPGLGSMRKNQSPSGSGTSGRS
jgi:serine/threonine protein phosphatase PrpC